MIPKIDARFFTLKTLSHSWSYGGINLEALRPSSTEAKIALAKARSLLLKKVLPENLLSLSHE
ncbi:hypothetical protein EM20IM_09190 [Candidatus Methylacidiphilum infernorum]|uniref:Uncharacterized protein n=1 Tax=Candidatus Methylacidiphilum infernorum TaxID=511746 RepID=A0ABX7PUH1_9BACT|nr:hypothetical protein [Candidatus Methylacidiphilum infernorum]QSR86640.1 hypothetical protein EM20IM_09190 [Candidatus Methylacidiphilum infernorum]